MSKPSNFAMVAEMISAATALHCLYEALIDQGFTEDQALTLVRDTLRPVGTAQ